MYEVYIIKVDDRPVFAGRIDTSKKDPSATYKSKCKFFGEKYKGQATCEINMTTTEVDLANARASRLTREIAQGLAQTEDVNAVRKKPVRFGNGYPDNAYVEYEMVNGTWVLRKVDYAV